MSVEPFLKPSNGGEKLPNRMEYLIRASSELHDLEPSFDDGNHIHKTEKGGYEVTTTQRLCVGEGSTAGLIDYETTTAFKNWDDAKEAYFEQTGRMEYTQPPEERDILAQNPLFEIQIGGSNLKFSRFEGYDPKIPPSEKTQRIPKMIWEYLMNEDLSNPELGTYQNTHKQSNWKTNIYQFVGSYLQNEGKNIAKEVGIDPKTDLGQLTPKQAAELSTRIVVDLTKSRTDNNIDLTVDNNTLSLLEDGLKNRSNPKWAGNGVCRNFACMTKAVYESLKENQKEGTNQLRNTYCIIHGGHEHSPEYVPYGYRLLPNHVWNYFVALNGNDAEITIVDPTWAKINPNGELTDVDYTALRMEPLVFDWGRHLLGSREDGNREESQKVVEYYNSWWDNIEGMRCNSSTGELCKFITERVATHLNLSGHYPDLSVDLTKSVMRGIKELGEEVQLKHLEVAYECLTQHPAAKSEPIIEDAIKNYLNRAQQDGSPVELPRLISNGLQEMICKQIHGK